MNSQTLIVVVLAWSLSPQITSAQSSEVSSIVVPLAGVVHSSTKVPLEGVQIELRSLLDGAAVATSTNSAGLFRYELAAGEYQLTATSRTQRASKRILVARGKNWVRLILNEKPRTISRPSISIHRLNVPPKARNAFKKARDALERNDPAAAARHIEKAIELYPHYVEAFAIRSMLERDNNPQQALTDAERAIAYDPNYGEGYLALASAYTSLGKFDDAVHMLDRAIALIPASWLGYYEMSRALLCKDDYAAALGHLEISSALAPKSYSFLHITRADAFIGLHDNAAASRELEAYLREDPHGEQVSKARQMLASLNSRLP